MSDHQRDVSVLEGVMVHCTTQLDLGVQRGSDIGFSSCAVLVLCGPGLAQMPGLAVGFDGLRPGLDWQSILSKPKYCIK